MTKETSELGTRIKENAAGFCIGFGADFQAAGFGRKHELRRVPAKHFQAFELHARQGQPVAQVAADLGINRPTVYIITHRLKKQLKHEVSRLRDYHQ